MKFKVVARTRSSPLRTTEHESAEDALARAVVLMTGGLAHIKIIDADGRPFTPAEFAREMNRETRETERDDR